MEVYTPKGIIDSKKLSGTLPYIESNITEKEYQAIKKDLPDFNGDTTNLNKKLYENQSLSDVASKSAWNFGINFIGGFTNMIGTIDPELIRALSGEDREHKTWISEWANEFMESNSTPIYEKDPGSVNPLDPGWYGNQASQLGNLGGILTEGVMEAFGIALAGNVIPGWFDEAIAAKGLYSKGKAAINLIKNNQKARLGFMGSQSLSGVREALLESNDIYTTKMNEYLDKGYSQEEAHKAASGGAKQNFIQNAIVKGVFNAAEAALLSYNPIRGLHNSGKVESFLEKALPNKYAFNTAKFATNNFGEGFEEWYQYAMQEEGSYLSDILIGARKDDKSVGERFGKYLQSGEAWNSAITGFLGGAIMGPAMSGAFKGINKIFNKNKLDQITKSDFGIRSEIFDELSKAAE